MANPLGRVADTVRDVARTRQILAVLLRYGFGDLLARLPLEAALAPGAAAMRQSPLRSVAQLSRGERIRRALEELGPAFVKLGQLLAGRPDLLPADLSDELAKLRDEVTPMPSGEAQATVEAELGKPVAELFAEFDPEPLAAGSIAQVHRAKLADGRAVAVKIQRLDVRPTLETDLRILGHLATLASGRLLPDGPVDPVEVVEELARTFARETDFRREARTLASFRRNFAGDATVRFPEPLREWSTEKVLVMELLAGERPAPAEELRAKGLDPALLARRGAQAFVRMVLDHGHFHADPHGGNLLFLPNNVVAFLDFGATGRLDPDTRDRLLDLLVALGTRDIAKTAELFVDLGRPGEGIDRRRLASDVADFVDEWSGRPLDDVPLGPFLSDFFGILGRNRIAFPPDLAVFARALVHLETEGRRLDPSFDLLAGIGDPVREFYLRRRSPTARLQRGWSELERGLAVLASIPAELGRILGLLEERKLEVRLSHVGLDGLVREIDRASNRIAFALVIAALVVGSAIVSNLAHGPLLWGYPAVGVAGFLLAAILGLGLAFSILRSGKL